MKLFEYQGLTAKRFSIKYKDHWQVHCLAYEDSWSTYRYQCL